MTFYLADDPNPGPANPAPAPNAGTMEVLGAAWEAESIETDAWQLSNRYRAEVIGEIEAKIGNYDGAAPPLPFGSVEGEWERRLFMERQVLARAGRFAAERPAEFGNLPLDAAQLEAEVTRRQRADWEEAQAVLQMGGFGSGVAEFTARSARAATDEFGLAFMLAGGPEFRPGLAGAARFMGIEGALGAVGEAFVLPRQYEMADRLGIPDPDALAQITLGAAGAAGLAGLGAAAHRGFTYAFGRAAGEAAARPAGADPIDAQVAVDEAEAALREGRAVPPPGPVDSYDAFAARVLGGSPSYAGVDAAAQSALDRLQAVSGPLDVISAARTPERNAAARGARGSQHLHGRAFDVDVSGMSIAERQDLIRQARAAGFSGIGVYDNSLHFDVGGDRAWGPSHGRDSLPAWASEAVAAPLGGSGDGGFDGVAGRIVGAESGGVANAKNPNSSATGLGQFIDGTWLALIRQHRPDLAEGRSEAEILALRGEGRLSREMTAAYARDNAALLAAEGLPTDHGSLYLAHFLGPDSAARALRGDPGAPVASAMSPEAIRANRNVRYGGKFLPDFTLGDLRRWAEVKMGQAQDPGMSWRPSTSGGYTQAGQVVTPAGTRLDVEYEIVDASTLIPASGDLQPRDRSRASSDEQIAEIAARLDPARLLPSPETDRGAPLVGPDDIIESGNGRVRAIVRAAEMHPDRYDAYRAAIADVAPIPEGVKTPVLIARRKTGLDPEARVRTVRESNTSSIARMSATEQAGMEGSAIAPADLALFDPGVPLSNPGNRAFARALLGRLPQAERAGLVDEAGGLNSAGARRLREALFARAYGAEDLTRVLTEDEGGDLRGLIKALGDAAPRWAMLRDEIAAGRVSAELDVTDNLAEGLRLIAAARATARATPGLSVRAALNDALAQIDAFTGPVDVVTARIVDVYYRPAGLRSQADVAALLNRYVDEALRVGDMENRLLAETGDATPEEIFDAIRAEDGQAPRRARLVDGDAEGSRAAERPEPDDREPGSGGGGDVPEQGPFGPVLMEYAGDPEGAIARLMADKTGEAVAVVDRPDIGPIALVYGDRKKGLAHIAHKHPKTLPLLPGLLRGGEIRVEEGSAGHAFIVDGSSPPNVVALRLDYDGVQNTWVVSAYEDRRGKFARQVRTSDEPPASASSRVPDATGQAEDTPSAPALQGPDIRLADDADFGAGSASPAVDAANRAAIADFRARLEAEGDFEIATGALVDTPDGKRAETVSARALLDEIEDADDLAEVIGACTLGGRRDA